MALTQQLHDLGQSLWLDNITRAEAKIMGSNRPPNYPKGMFRLGWIMARNCT